MSLTDICVDINFPRAFTSKNLVQLIVPSIEAPYGGVISDKNTIKTMLENTTLSMLVNEMNADIFYLKR